MRVITVEYEPTEWIAEFFDEPFYFQCIHPVVDTEEALSFDGENVYEIKKCFDCGEVVA